MSRDPQDNENVFGDPITDKGSRLENADYALKHDKVDKKYDHAVAYVNNEKDSFGSGVSTRCVFYNATGETLTTKPIEYSYDGKIWDSYPVEVKNGQWGAFLHVGYKKTDPGSKADTGSKAYVAYRVKAKNDVDFCKSLFGWDTPLTQSPPATDTHAFCVVFDDADDIKKDEISGDIEKAPKEYASPTFKGISMTTKIESGTSPFLTVYFLLK